MRLWVMTFIVVVLAILAVLTAVQFPILVSWFQHNLSQNLVLSLLIAVIVFGLASERYWRFRDHARFWIVLAICLVLHFLVVTPVLGRLGVVKWGHIQEMYMYAIGFAEGALVLLIMRWVTEPLARSEDSA